MKSLEKYTNHEIPRWNYFRKNIPVYIYYCFFDILENLIFRYEILRKIYKSWNSEMKLFYDSIIKKYIISKFYNLKIL